MTADLERSAAEAWPALECQEVEGWICRQAAGYTRRANSCLPLDHPREGLDYRIDAVEAWYDRAGQAAIFKLPEEGPWQALDARLAARGYREEAPSLVLTCPLPLSPGFPVGPEFVASVGFDDQWFSGYAEASGLVPGHRGPARAIGAQMTHPVTAKVTGDGTDIAWALASLVNDTAWIFDVVVAPDRRRQGWGTVLLTGLIDRAYRQGASRACLQVAADNQAARSLYSALGFTPVYGYHYRRRS